MKSPATQLALAALAAAALVALSLVYSRRLGAELLAQLEIAELERIPVLEEG